MALRAMRQMRVDFGFLTETKLSHDKYTHEYQGYKVYAMTSSPNQGGVALFFHNSNQWTVEGVRSFGPNIIRCSLVSGSHRWTIFGIYIPPSDSAGETLHWLEQASVHSTRHPVILMGDLNVDLDHIRDDRGHDIADALALLGVSDVSCILVEVGHGPKPDRTDTSVWLLIICFLHHPRTSLDGRLNTHVIAAIIALLLAIFGWMVFVNIKNTCVNINPTLTNL